MNFSATIRAAHVSWPGISSMPTDEGVLLLTLVLLHPQLCTSGGRQQSDFDIEPSKAQSLDTAQSESGLDAGR